MSEKERVGGLAVEERPQVIVELVGRQDIEITVSRIGEGFDTVETTTVSFPAECGRAVAKAITDLLKR